MHEVATIEMAAYGGKADGSDRTPNVRAALDKAYRSKATKLTFPPGRDYFWPENASEQYLFTCNSGKGLKRIPFPHQRLEGLEIDDCGASFIFHTPSELFLTEESRGVALKNFSVDSSRSFYTERRFLANTATMRTRYSLKSFPMRSGAPCSFSPTKKIIRCSNDHDHRSRALSLRRPDRVRSGRAGTLTHREESSQLERRTGYDEHRLQSVVAHNSHGFGQTLERVRRWGGNNGRSHLYI